MRDHINSHPNFTAGDDSDFGDTASESREGEDSLWVEIGCNIFQAQLIKNVTLM